MIIKFLASLQGRNCINIDDEGASVIKLTLSADEVHNAVKMVTKRGRNFVVTIEEEE